MRNCFYFFFFAVFLTACAGTKLNVAPVKEFQTQRYLGTWYEIARLDHRFERGLTHVTANYSIRPDGKIRVLNSGFDTRNGRRRTAEGKAKLAGSPDIGELRVSFFGPFYAPYIIFGLDNNYQTAFVSGGSDNYLWLLSRSPRVSQATYDRFIAEAAQLGYDTSGLIQVPQN